MLNAYILSLPRSGSTVLTSILDRRDGVVCMPESAFPQVLGVITEKERVDKRWMAALYVASSFSGTLLTVDEAESCMVGDNGEILSRLGYAMAEKTSRPAERVRLVVWKSTRMVSNLRGPLSTGGRFIVLRRHPHNVYDSQFRVPFGVNNRKPWRFALFRASYEAAFRAIPAGLRYDLEYEEIPQRMEEMLAFVGFADQGEWASGGSSFDGVVESRPWHSQIRAGFQSTDARKREAVPAGTAVMLDRMEGYMKTIGPVMPLLRKRYDLRNLADIRGRARLLVPHRS
jgi:hypothetical protein